MRPRSLGSHNLSRGRTSPPSPRSLLPRIHFPRPTTCSALGIFLAANKLILRSFPPPPLLCQERVLSLSCFVRARSRSSSKGSVPPELVLPRLIQAKRRVSCYLFWIRALGFLLLSDTFRLPHWRVCVGLSLQFLFFKAREAGLQRPPLPFPLPTMRPPCFSGRFPYSPRPFFMSGQAF